MSLEVVLSTKEEVLQGQLNVGFQTRPCPVSHGLGRRPPLAWWPSLALWGQVSCAPASLGPVSSLRVSPVMSMRPYPPSCP